MSRLFVAVAALVAAIFTGSETEAQARSQAEPPTVSCQITEVSAFFNRVQVRCVAIPSQNGPISYFAVGHDSYAASFLALATAAKQANKPLMITYNPATNNNPVGCGAGDCRVPILTRLFY